MTTKTTDKLGAIKKFSYDNPNNTIMWACMLSMVAVRDEWKTGDFEKIVKEIQDEAYKAGHAACDCGR